MAGDYHLALTIKARSYDSVDDCDHATLIGIVRRALEGSTEFQTKYAGQLVDVVAENTQDSMSDQPYRSTFRVALPCGCMPHQTRMSTFGTALYCETEQNPYCNFECPHEGNTQHVDK